MCLLNRRLDDRHGPGRGLRLWIGSTHAIPAEPLSVVATGAHECDSNARCASSTSASMTNGQREQVMVTGFWLTHDAVGILTASTFPQTQHAER
jgi:hypothetical protein